MNRQSQKRLIALLCCVCLIIITLLATAVNITHAHHDCVGDACTTCVQIHTAQNLLKQLGLAVACFAVAAAVVVVAARLLQVVSCLIAMETPVTMKIRMNN